MLATSRLWRKVTEEVRTAFPDVALEHRLVDSAAMLLAKTPAAFDVLVTENLFGDILSDEAAPKDFPRNTVARACGARVSMFPKISSG